MAIDIPTGVQLANSGLAQTPPYKPVLIPQPSWSAEQERQHLLDMVANYELYISPKYRTTITRDTVTHALLAGKNVPGWVQLALQGTPSVTLPPIGLYGGQYAPPNINGFIGGDPNTIATASDVNALSDAQLAELRDAEYQHYLQSQQGGIGPLEGILSVLGAGLAFGGLTGLLGTAESASSAAAGAGSAVTGAVSSTAGGIAGDIASAASTLGSLTHTITSGIEGLIGSGTGSVTSAITSAVSGISSLVSSASSTVKAIISPITSTLDSVTKLAQQIQDNLITPIVTPITTAISQFKTLSASIEADIHNGLTGILQIPGQIAGALTSTDASFNRATQQLGLQNSNIAKNILGPALLQSGAEPIGKLHTAFQLTEIQQQQSGAAFETLDKLAGTNPALSTLTGRALSEVTSALGIGGVPSPEQLVKDIAEKLQTLDAWYLEPVKWAWNLGILTEFVVAGLQVSLKAVEQQANADFPVERLGAGEMVEARRRGLVSESDYAAELAAQGIDPTRQKLLLDLAQFLFGPKEAVELKARGIIDDATFKELIDQNNLDDAQAASLTELMQRLLSAGEIATASARGLIDEPTQTKLFDAALIPADLRALVQQLAINIVNPRSVLENTGRARAAAAGFLADSLGTDAPTDIKARYAQAQISEEQATQDWMRHFRVPPAAWWVDAYFRGIRTQSEVYQALEAENVPPEIWDDVIAVERELLPVWMIPDIIASGAMDKEAALKFAGKLGFDPADALILYNYGYSKSKASKAATAADLAKLSLTNAKTLFENGGLTQQQYVEVLLEHGYSQEAADLTVETTQIQLALKERKDYATYIVDLVDLGQSTIADAVNTLVKAGFTAEEVTKYETQMKRTKAKAAKLPSRSEIDKLYDNGTIAYDLWLNFMEQLGYSQAIAELLVTLTKRGAPNAAGP